MERTIVVGDVHGCLDELRTLLTVLGHRPGDPVVLAGDLVAKGPDSAGVLALAREVGALGVLGNHDAHVLRAREVLRAVDPSYEVKFKPEHRRVVETLAQEDWTYLEALPPLLRLGPERIGQADTVVVHAGVVPGILLERQSREHLITMRSLNKRGEPSKKIEGTPWAVAWRGPEHVVFGHDAVRGLQQEAFATGLDTGCVYGHRLTALVLPERRLVSVPARRAYAKL